MAILVLGGAGYIGSHTVYELIEAGRDVVVADNLLTGFRAAVHPKARFYNADIRDRKAMDELFEKEKIDGVIHFAASSQVGESMTDPLKYYDNNLCGTACLLQSMVAHGVDKIVFSSTAVLSVSIFGVSTASTSVSLTLSSVSSLSTIDTELTLLSSFKLISLTP